MSQSVSSSAALPSSQGGQSAASEKASSAAFVKPVAKEVLPTPPAAKQAVKQPDISVTEVPVAPPASSQGGTGAAQPYVPESYWGDTGMADINQVYEYGKTLLSSKEQQTYDQLAAGVLGLQSSITIDTDLDPISMETVCRYYLEDHAEDFFLNTTSPAGLTGSYYMDNTGSKVYVKYVVTPNYIYSAASIPSMRGNMNAAAKKMLEEAKAAAAAGGGAEHGAGRT